MSDPDVRRERLRRDGPRPTVPPAWPAGNAAMVGQVITAPSAVGQFFPVGPVTVTGEETAGAPGAFAAGTDQVQVYFLGDKLPEAGSNVLCRFVDFRWVAEAGGAPCRLITFTVQLCTVPVRSTPVTFIQGGTTLSGTTNSSGQVTLLFPSGGDWAYSIGITGDTTGYQHLTGTVAVTCGATSARYLDPGCSVPAVLTYRGSVGQAQASFYFVNATVASPEPSTYTLTWQPRPADVPASLQLLYYSYPGGVHDPYYIDMPASAWFSDPIPGYLFGNPTTIYFYGFRSNACTFEVMVIDTPYGVGGYTDPARGAGNNVIQYSHLSCVPFKMTTSFAPGWPAEITGTHGGDDRTGAQDGLYSHPRVGL